MEKGIFITFEGIEACGKTTQSKLLYSYLIDNGYKAVLTREPGGTELGKKIREILLSHTEEKFPKIAELLLYEADRNIHIHNVIKPKLEEGFIVISDRFYDSTTAYQHYGRNIDFSIVDYLNRLATEGYKPDITFLIDIPVEKAFERLKSKDRLESESIDFHIKVREGFLYIARKDVDRVVMLDGLQSIEDIFKQVISILKNRNIIK
ncbi:MAG: dTMP kinase [Hydrogenothermaceae bacterium]|nr:dTMP kinase [Hydrogenothermaceae bacterium]